MSADGRRRSVLFLHPADEGYGADRVLLMAIEGLQNAGWSVRVLLPDDAPPGWLSGQLAARRVAVDRGPLAPARRRYLRPLGLPRYVANLLRARRFVRSVARDWKPQIIHINTTALLVGLLLGRPAGARLVWHVHEIVVSPLILAWIFRVAPMISADRVVAISDAVRVWLTAVPVRRRRVRRIYNGIDPSDTTSRAQRTGSTVGFVGRINRWKGAALFVEAALMVAERHPEATFLIAGDAPLGEESRSLEIQALISDSGLAGRLRMLGYCDDVPALLAAVDIVAVPSVWPEPFGLVVAEAMRAGCAVVASDHGGAAELLDGGRCGLLVEPGSASALADALERLLSDDDLRHRLAVAGRERVSSVFGRDRFVAELAALYEGIVQ